MCSVNGCFSQNCTLFFPHLEFESHYRYLKGISSLGLWYPKGSGLDLKGTMQVAMSLAEAEYVVAAGVDHILKGDIELHFIPTEYQLADIFTKPLVEPSFTRLAAELGLDVSADTVSIPKKEIIKEALGTLGLVDENDLSTSSKDLINKSPVKVKYFTPTWRGLDIGLANILYSDLTAKLINKDKKTRGINICYARFISLIIEHMLGKSYKNKNLKPFLAHQITASSYGTPSENEVPMTSHMYNIVGLPRPNESLIPSPQKVNDDESFDKSPSRTSMKRHSKKQPSDTQHTEDSKVLADIPSIDASESAEELGNQPQTANTTKYQPLVDTTIGNDEPITEKVQETSNDDKTKADFSEPESMPDDEFMDFTKDAGIAESEEETGNIHAYAEQPSQTTTSLTPIPFPSMQNVQELWVKKYGKGNTTNQLLQSLLIRKWSAPSLLYLQKSKTWEISLEHLPQRQLRTLSTLYCLNSSMIFWSPNCLRHSHHVPDLLYTELKEVMEYVNDKFEELNKMESQRFAILEKALSKALSKAQLNHSWIKLWICSNVPLVIIFSYLVGQFSNLASKTSKDMTELVELMTRVGEPEETGLAKNLTMVVHKDADLKESDPPEKKPKVTFEMLTPIQSVMPPAFTDIPFSRFAANLFKAEESKFSPSPPRHDIQDKGKGIAEPNEDDQIKMIMPLVEEEGSNPDLSELKKFRGTRERPMTIKEARQKMEEHKRLADIKKSKEESKKALKKMSLAERQAQRL
ncbi:hypothetical protein Tco_0226303 [Tanacetum coccineum]